MVAKKTKGHHLMYIGGLVIIIGAVFLILCLVMASKAHEQPWPRDAYVYYWFLTFPMLSIYGITIGVVILIEGLVQTSILKPRTVSMGLIILMIGPIVIYLFTEQINDLWGVSFNFGQFLVALGGFYLISIGTIFLITRVYRYLKERDINEEHRKYTCAKCGFKTKKLAFQPVDCPKCGVAFINSS